MTNAGRTAVIATWGLVVINAGTQTILGEGIGGGDGWSPQFGDFLLERAYLQSNDFYAQPGTTLPSVFGKVEKNGSTTLYNVSHTMAANGSGAGNLHIDTDTTNYLLTPSDYITAQVGHTGYVSGTHYSKDVGFIVEGRYVSGPLAGQGVHIKKNGNTRLFHINGAMNSAANVFSLIGVSNKVGGTSAWGTKHYKGWPVEVPMRLKRISQHLKVGSPTVAPDINDLVTSVWVNDPSTSPDMQITRSLNTGIGASRTDTDTSDTIVVPGDELWFDINQVRTAGAGTATLVDLNLYLDVEYL